MAASSSVAPTSKGFQAEITDLFRDPITKKPLRETIVIFPCGHIFDETTLVGRTTCPLDEQPIEFSTLSHTVRTLAEDVFKYKEPSPPLLEEAAKHFALGKELLATQQFSEALEAFRAAKGIAPADPFVEIHTVMTGQAVKTRLDLANNGASGRKESYLKDLERIIGLPGVQQDPDLLRIIGEQFVAVTEVESDILPPAIRQTADWVRRLPAEDNQMRGFVAKRLKEMFPSRVEEGPADLFEGDSGDELFPVVVTERLDERILSRAEGEPVDVSDIDSGRELPPPVGRKESYLKDLERIAGLSWIQQDPDLLRIIEEEFVKLTEVEADVLPQEIRQIAGWVRRLSSEDNRVREFVVNKLKGMFPSRAEGGPADLSEDDSRDEVTLSRAKGGTASASEGPSDERDSPTTNLVVQANTSRLPPKASKIAPGQFADCEADTSDTSLIITPVALPAKKALEKLPPGQKRDRGGPAEIQSENREVEMVSLHDAAGRGDLATVRRWIERRGDLNLLDEQQSPLHCAALAGHPEIVEALCRAGANKDLKGCQQNLAPLFGAIQGGNIEVVRILLRERAAVGTRSFQQATPLHAAVHHQRGDMISELLAYQADPYAEAETEAQSGITPMAIAVLEGLDGMVRMLAARGIDVNRRNSLGWCPIHFAADSGKEITVAALVDCGADLNLKISGGSTPLHLSLEKSHCSTAVALLLHGADPNASDDQLETPLHIAVRNGIDCLGLLVERGARLDVYNAQHWGPLHIALDLGRVDTVKALIGLGADPKAKSPLGVSPLDVARASGRKEITDLFRGGKCVCS